MKPYRKPEQRGRLKVKHLIPKTEGQLTHLEEVAGRAKEYIGQAKAANTIKAYRSDWNHFAAWCQGQGLDPLPAAPQTVALYLTALAEAGRKASTLQRRLSSISQAHQMAGHDSPTRDIQVRTVWAGIRRSKGTAQTRKAPAVTQDVQAMVATLPDNLLGLRDRALLLIGFAGAFRRSELVSLDVEDVEECAEGLRVTLRRSKTDQEGAGEVKGIPYGRKLETCPVRALRAWLEAAGITAGPIFRSVNRHGQVQPGRLSDKAVALVVKRAAEAAGLDASRYAGHSLRAGLATSAAAAGVQERDIMRQTGHRSVNMVRRYIREGELFRSNAAAQVGL
jgi:site-specific recombinase XerD